MRISTGPVPFRPISSTNVDRASQSKTSASTEATEHRQTSLGNLISRSQLLELSADLKNGLVTKEEARHRFIDTVTSNSVRDNLSEKDRAQIARHIDDFFSHDQDFLKNLTKHLSNLA